MKLSVGQRWKRIGFGGYIVELKEVADLMHIKGIIMNAGDNPFNYPSLVREWRLLPLDGSDHNDDWEYLKGQDKPE